MEKRYTSKVGRELTERLYKAGMQLRVNTNFEINKFTNMVEKKLDIEPPSYAKTLDWLASKGMTVHVYSYPCWHNGANRYCTTEYDINIHDENAHVVITTDPNKDFEFHTWHEAADYGIHHALTFLEHEPETNQ